MGKPAVLKTKKSEASVADFLNSIADAEKRLDSQRIVEWMTKATNEQPKMWGASMVGFGEVRYKSPASGREVDWFKIGFSPRKANLSLHLIDLKRHEADLALLGKHKTGMGCLYINRLQDVDIVILQKIINNAV